MDDRFAPRLQEMLDSAVCHPEVTVGTLARLETFLGPYAESLTEPAQRTHTREYVQGLADGRYTGHHKVRARIAKLAMGGKP